MGGNSLRLLAFLKKPERDTSPSPDAVMSKEFCQSYRTRSFNVGCFDVFIANVTDGWIIIFLNTFQNKISLESVYRLFFSTSISKLLRKSLRLRHQSKCPFYL